MDAKEVIMNDRICSECGADMEAEGHYFDCSLDPDPYKGPMGAEPSADLLLWD